MRCRRTCPGSSASTGCPRSCSWSTASPGVALTVNVDGFGDRPNKRSKYREFTRGRRDRHHGLKLFYSEDTNLMQPRHVLGLRPPPELVVYE
jgi:hypothetical protein